jgi:hypothetical protein
MKNVMMILVLAGFALADIVALKNGTVYENVRFSTQGDSVLIEHYQFGEIKSFKLPSNGIRFTESQDYDLTKPAVTHYDIDYKPQKVQAQVKQEGIHFKKAPDAADYLQNAGNAKLFSTLCAVGAGVSAIYVSPFVAGAFGAAAIISEIIVGINLKKAGLALENDTVMTAR